jgi:hypothetical protein
MSVYTVGTRVLVTPVGSSTRSVGGVGTHVDTVARVQGDSVWLKRMTNHAFHTSTGMERRLGAAQYQIRPATPEEVEEYRARGETDRLVRIVEDFLWATRRAGTPTATLQELVAIVQKNTSASG